MIKKTKDKAREEGTGWGWRKEYTYNLKVSEVTWLSRILEC